MTAYLSSVFGSGAQLFNNNGQPLNGGKIYTYSAGTSTPIATYTTQTGNIANSNPIVLDANGRPPSQIWITSGQAIKFVVNDSVGNLISTNDNILGVNDPSLDSEWINSGYTPSYISATQFSVVGNAVSIYDVNRRVQALISLGYIYGYISASVYSAGYTTVTVVWDSTVMDNTLSIVNYALLNGQNQSVPLNLNPTNSNPTVNTLSDLVKSSSIIPNKIIVYGYSSEGDGGGGTYYRNASDTTSGCVFIGALSAGSLTVSSVTSGALAIGQAVRRSDTGALVGWITAGSGTSWTVSGGATVASMTLMADNGGSIVVGADGGRWYLQPSGSVSVKQFGAKGDGVTDDTSAIVAAQAAMVALSSSYFGCVNFPAASYKFTSFGKSPRVEFHAIGDVVLTTALSTGNAITVSGAYGDTLTQYPTKVFSGNFAIINTTTTNTATCLYIGDTPPSTTYSAAFCVFETLAVHGFSVVHTYGNNAYLNKFVECEFSGQTVSGTSTFLYNSGALTNAGENLSYVDCVIHNFTYVATIATAGLELNFIGGSLDYNTSVLPNNASTSILRFISNHFEWNNTTTAVFQINGTVVVVEDPYFIFTGASSTAPAMIAIVGGTSGSLTIHAPTYNIGINNYYYYVATSSAVLNLTTAARQFGTYPAVGLVTNPGAGTLISDGCIQSIGSSGYIKLPPDPLTGKSVIRQWGTIPSTALTANGQIPVTVTFPIPFPTAVTYGHATGQPDTSNDFYGVVARDVTGTPLATTTFIIRNGATAQNFINGVYVAEGY